MAECTCIYKAVESGYHDMTCPANRRFTCVWCHEVVEPLHECPAFGKLTENPQWMRCAKGEHEDSREVSLKPKAWESDSVRWLRRLNANVCRHCRCLFVEKS